MKYTINHTCGHESEKQIYGTNAHGERERKVAYYESLPCPECSTKEKATKSGTEIEEIEMHYSEYKNNYADCKTKPGSYDGKAKTIIVYVPKATAADEVIEDTELAELDEIVTTYINEQMATVPSATEEQKAAFTAELERAYTAIKKVWHEINGCSTKDKATQLYINLTRYIPETDYLNPHGAKDKTLNDLCKAILSRIKNN